jgi:hypothetical protein
MIAINMINGGVSAAGDWRTPRVASLAASKAAFAGAHHAIPSPKRRTAAATVASVNRGPS